MLIKGTHASGYMYINEQNHQVKYLSTHKIECCKEYFLNVICVCVCMMIKLKKKVENVVCCLPS